MERYAADLELARRCAEGDADAWERFVHEYRPLLYRAADSLDASGRAREIADALYADLYGVASPDGERRSLLRYFQGRSSLATWLRAVLAQRFVDTVRAGRRFDPLPEQEDAGAVAAADVDLHRPRYIALMRRALDRAVAALAARDRLRIGCYYVQELTLAETGRLLGEHEATVSRQLARTRRAIRDAVEQDLVNAAGLSEAEIAECFASASADPGPIDLAAMLNVRSGWET